MLLNHVSGTIAKAFLSYSIPKLRQGEHEGLSITTRAGGDQAEWASENPRRSEARITYPMDTLMVDGNSLWPASFDLRFYVIYATQFRGHRFPPPKQRGLGANERVPSDTLMLQSRHKTNLCITYIASKTKLRTVIAWSTNNVQRNSNRPGDWKSPQLVDLI